MKRLNARFPHASNESSAALSIATAVQEALGACDPKEPKEPIAPNDPAPVFRLRQPRPSSSSPLAIVIHDTRENNQQHDDLKPARTKSPRSNHTPKSELRRRKSLSKPPEAQVNEIHKPLETKETPPIQETKTSSKTFVSFTRLRQQKAPATDGPIAPRTPQKLFFQQPEDKQTDEEGNQNQNNQTPEASTVSIPRIGDLSRDEDEFDFAILLKPSKQEESLTQDDDVVVEDDQEEEYNVVMTAPATKTHMVCKKKDPKRARALLIQRITRTGLQIKRLLSLDGHQTLLKVKAPPLILERGAELMKLKKRRKFDQIWMDFTRDMRQTFADYDPQTDQVQFIDREKQSIVHMLLTADAPHGAGLNEFCELKTKYVQQMFPLHKQNLGILRMQWITYWRTNSDTPAHCGHRMAKIVTLALAQPIDAVAEYFGEKIAFYFAWIELYTRWLILPSVAGVILFLCQIQSKSLDHPAAPVYAVCMAIWSSAFLLAWKRHASRLAYRWGTLGYEDEETTRPEYYGNASNENDPSAKRYPMWKRVLKYMVTIPSVLVSIVALLALTYYAFATRDRLEIEAIQAQVEAKHLAIDMARDLHSGMTLENLKKLSNIGMQWQFWFYFLITPILYGLLIPILDFVFTKWARRMTNWENHKTETRHQSHLILKVFSFRFVHVFASLYYYAFANARGDNLLRVAIQLASFMVAGQLWKNVMETLYPFLKRKLALQQKKKATNEQFNQSAVFNAVLSHGNAHQPMHAALHDNMLGRNAGPWNSRNGPILMNQNAVIHEQCVRLEQASDKAWEEADLEQYDTFEDYTEMLIQFGYVSFFSIAFPLAPLLALLNNVFEIRADAFKLCHAKQRPIAHKASDIGIWFHVLQLMSVLAVLTNCLHIAFTTTQIEHLMPTIAPTTKVWIVFVLEHAILATKVWMMVVIPSMPSDVKEKVRLEREHTKRESARAMANKLQEEEPLPAHEHHVHQSNEVEVK